MDVPTSEGRRAYLDAGVVAPVRPDALQAYLAAVEEGWADPRRLHHEGRRARLLLDAAREAVADGLGAHPDEVVFTGGHREAVVNAVQGTQAARSRAGLVVHSAVEHSAVVAAAEHGPHPAVSVPVDRLGRVRVDALRNALRAPAAPPPALVCVQSANAEVGTRQPVAAVAEVCAEAAVPLFVDAAASVGNEPPPQRWDLLAADARTWGALPGVGVLAVRRAARWTPPGPAHDGVERGGGEPGLPAVFAAAVALQAAAAAVPDADRLRRPLVGLVREAAAAVPDTEVVGDPDDRLPHVVTFSSLFVDGEVVVGELDALGFAVGSGSACTSATLRPSHVLEAMGVLSHGNVRVGLPSTIGRDDVERFCAHLPGVVGRVRARLGAEGL